MTMLSTHRRGAHCAFGGLFLVLSLSLCAASKSAAPAAPTDRVVELTPLVVEGAKFYVPLEPGWKVAEVPGFRVYSHGSGATKRIMDELQVVREAVGLVWGDERLLRQLVSVVVCDNEPEFLRWANVSPAAFDRLTRAIRTPSGLVLVLDGGDDTVHRAVGRAYVHGLLEGSGMPRWLQEGLAAIINSAELQGDRLIVGKINFDPRDAVSMDELRGLSMTAAFATTPVGGRTADSVRVGNVNAPGSDPVLINNRGEAVEILVDGVPPTFGELRKAVEEELDRRHDRRTQAQGDAEFTGYLRDSIVMDLEKLFDPKTEETVRWRMNAWAFLHLGLFGHQNRYRPALAAFVQMLQENPGRSPTELFKEAFGEAPGRFELRMRSYAEGGNYVALNFKLDRPFEPATPVLESLPEANVLLLKARLYGATGRRAEARDFLRRGYAEPSNRVPDYVAAYAQLLRQSDRPQALEVLEAADQKGRLNHDGRCLQAELRLEKFTAQNPRLTPGELSLVLDPLFAALNQGDVSEHLFVLIGRAWQTSATPPTDGQLNALRLGLRYYPESSRLGEMLRQFEHKG
ncbi:MAG: hypothetical protein QG602_648 [Verrucomicrobiota bacterium]|nr:hypothetical protein [Verrucomicrobiota bacterium]